MAEEESQVSVVPSILDVPLRDGTNATNASFRRVPHSRSSSTSSAASIHGLEDSFEFIGSDSRDLNNIDLHINGNSQEGEYADAYSSSPSENEEDGQNFPDEEDVINPSQRLAKLRNTKRQPFSTPTNFRVLYVGSPPNEQLKQTLFHKFAEALSSIFWEEANSNLQSSDIGPEKKSNLLPISNYQEARLEYYHDSGVAISEADFTNRPYEEVLTYLQNQFQKKENDDDLIDLCIFFIPTDIIILSRDILPFMKKLQGKVTLFPLIASINDLNVSGIYFRNECEEQRRSIAKFFEDNGIDIFIWKEDGLVHDRNAKGEQISGWVETMYTKKILAVEEFASWEASKIFEDMQLLRERSLEIRKDRQHDEMVKKRAQNFERFVEILRTITIMLTILYTFYLVVFGVWSYAEWSVIPSDLRESLEVVSSATSRMQAQNIPFDTANYDDAVRFEVTQLSPRRFVIDTYPKRRSESYEVIVKHNPQILRQYEAKDMGNGIYEFEIDPTGAQGDVIVEIRDKLGEMIKTIQWSPNNIGHVAKKGAENPAIKQEAEQGKEFRGYSTIAVHNIKFWASLLVNKVESFFEAVGENLSFVAHKAASWASSTKEEIQAGIPIFWNKVKGWAKYLKDRINDGRQNIVAYFEED
ncbi:hypothetical protein G9A89_022642 [Geosiphon pyriformis]|nr:hypothetical protein G9A89_022642 [Geosiphon pyriformis]